MKLFSVYIFIVLFKIVDCKFIRNTHNYPSNLINIDILDKFYVIEIPYCKKSFCYVRDIHNGINIKSTESFYLDKNITIVDGKLDKLFLKDSFNGLAVIIPKMIEKKEKSKINYSNIVKSALKLDGFYISEGIKIEDVSNKNLVSEKDSDAVSGYYNNRNRWIPY